MREIVYYVASSLDGFIAGPDDDVSGFVAEGNGVDQYLNDLQEFDTVIMGSNTYEFGYKFGVAPGQPSPVYLHMNHYIFSDNLTFEHQSEKVHVCKMQPQEVDKIRSQSGSDIYLCGGGQFAGWLLDLQKIDILKVKLNPLIVGWGTRLFENSQTNIKLELLDTERYDKGLQIMTYRIIY